MQGEDHPLREKVERILTLLEHVKQENRSLREENKKLREQLSSIQKEYNNFKLKDADKAQNVKSKLISILDRLEELESLHK